MFLATQSGDLSASERSSCERTQRFSQLTLQLPHEQNFQSRKHLDKFFKIFVLSVLATCLRLDSVGKIAWFAQKGQFLKLFSFPSNFSNCSLFGLFISLTNPPCVSQKSPLFFIISTSFFKNRYGFSYYPTAFHVCSMWFLHF